MKSFIFFLIFIVFSINAHCADLRGRLGVGASNQLANGLPALSFKIQNSKTLALGGVLGLKSDENSTLYGLGAKFYRVIFDEPQLNFYLAGLFAMQNYLNEERETQSGYQFDGTLGTEFHLAGLESIGFSFEFGLSARNTNSQEGSTIQTLADHLIKAGVHFYL